MANRLFYIALILVGLFGIGYVAWLILDSFPAGDVLFKYGEVRRAAFVVLGAGVIIGLTLVFGIKGLLQKEKHD